MHPPAENPTVHPTGLSPTGLQRVLDRHPRALGGDPVRNAGAPVLSLSDRVINNTPNAHFAQSKRKPA